MATTVSTPPPIPGQRQSPIWPLVVGTHGAFMYVRKGPGDGACGVGKYPCTHPGLDVNGPNGKRVNAPENGVVTFVASGQSSPVGGYGPWVVIIRGDSGVFHLVAHLDWRNASMAPIGRRVRAGDQIGTVSTANHVHWEVRRKQFPNFAAGDSNAANNIDPIPWLASGGSIGSLAPFLLLGGAATLLYMLWND